jgi:hypothetical protein
MSIVVAQSGPTKKVSGLPHPSGVGSASPDHLGEGPTSPDLSSEGSASPNPSGIGSASPDPSGTDSASPDPYEHARSQVRVRAPMPGPCRTSTTPSVATHDPDVRREVWVTTP